MNSRHTLVKLPMGLASQLNLLHAGKSAERRQLLQRCVCGGADIEHRPGVCPCRCDGRPGRMSANEEAIRCSVSTGAASEPVLGQMVPMPFRRDGSLRQRSEPTMEARRGGCVNTMEGTPQGQ